MLRLAIVPILCQPQGIETGRPLLDIIDYLVTHIAPLPWIVKGPGLLFMIALVFRAISQFMSLRWIKAVTSLVMVIVIALIMARFGSDIATFMETQLVQPPANES